MLPAAVVLFLVSVKTITFAHPVYYILTKQAVSKTTFHDTLKFWEFPTHEVNILISLHFVYAYI